MSKEAKILIAIIGAMLLVAAGIFLFSRDGYGSGPTGAELLAGQDAQYLTSAAIFVGLGITAIIGAVIAYRKIQQVAVSIGLAVAAVVLIFIGIGKFATDKTNHGVTAPSGRIQTEKSK